MSSLKNVGEYLSMYQEYMASSTRKFALENETIVKSLLSLDLASCTNKELTQPTRISGFCGIRFLTMGCADVLEGRDKGWGAIKYGLALSSWGLLAGLYAACRPEKRLWKRGGILDSEHFYSAMLSFCLLGDKEHALRLADVFADGVRFKAIGTLQKVAPWEDVQSSYYWFAFKAFEACFGVDLNIYPKIVCHEPALANLIEEAKESRISAQTVTEAYQLRVDVGVLVDSDKRSFLGWGLSLYPIEFLVARKIAGGQFPEVSAPLLDSALFKEHPDQLVSTSQLVKDFAAFTDKLERYYHEEWKHQAGQA